MEFARPRLSGRAREVKDRVLGGDTPTQHDSLKFRKVEVSPYPPVKGRVATQCL